MRTSQIPPILTWVYRAIFQDLQIHKNMDIKIGLSMKAWQVTNLCWLLKKDLLHLGNCKILIGLMIMRLEAVQLERKMISEEIKVKTQILRLKSMGSDHQFIWPVAWSMAPSETSVNLRVENLISWNQLIETNTFQTFHMSVMKLKLEKTRSRGSHYPNPCQLLKRLIMIMAFSIKEPQ